MPGLLEPDFLAWLERLRVVSGRAPASGGPGEHRSPGRGRSAEFSEHRDYRPGDDFRQIDWKAWGRLDRLYLKVFTEERERTVSILLDGSASMEAAGPSGPGPVSKFDHARRLAAALAWLSLGGTNRVAVGLLAGRRVHWQPPVRGRGQALTLFRFLEEARAQGATDLAASLGDFGARSGRPGLVVILSDFLQPGAGLEGLKALRSRKNELLVAQVLDPGELEPAEGGDLRLVDAETGAGRELTLDERVMGAYRRALRGLCDELSDWCRRQGCAWQLVRTDGSLRESLPELLRRGNLLR